MKSVAPDLRTFEGPLYVERALAIASEEAGIGGGQRAEGGG